MSQKNWNDTDYLKDYIEKQDYKIKTDIDNLINMLFLQYGGELEDLERDTYLETNLKKESLMIDIKDIEAFIYDMGGLSEFDYYC